MGWQVALGVVPFVRVLPAPLVATWGQFVGCQRAGTWCKTEGEQRDGVGQINLRQRKTRNKQTVPFCQIFRLRPSRVPKRGMQHRSPAASHLQVMMIVFSPSQEGLSAMTLAWVVTSCGDSCGDSFGWV